jgi:muramoyltetrapeptide carboxypeptidase
VEPAVRPGDRVAIIAPAGLVPEAALAIGGEALRSWGFEVVVGEHVLDKHPTLPYLAGTDADRAADFMRAWCDPTVRAVFAARGGYGALRTLAHLDLGRVREQPKTLVGSSDITALHRAVGGVTLFGPMPATAPFADDPVATEDLRRMLFAPAQAPPYQGETLVAGTATGPLVGGTLSLLVSGVGVVPDPPPGAIVLLEDVNEQPYRIDHFLTHLLAAGWFDAVGGIALGSWEKCGKDPGAVRDVLADRLLPLGVPIAADLRFGHCPGARTVPLGALATLTDGTLTLES